jgi:predicted TIM-barrel fold metal-dependent hydrolase
MCLRNLVAWKLALAIILVAGILTAGGFSSLSMPPDQPSPGNLMTMEELTKMPKIDAHAHLGENAEKSRARFIAFLTKHHLKWLDICTMGTDWKKMQSQIVSAERFHKDYSAQISWATSFNLENWGSGDWTETSIGTIKQSFAQGAVAVKVWKEIGMVVKDPDGHYVMIDDARFDPLFDYIESQGKTLVAHISEPRNCWLPLESMTVDSDRHYYKENPQYHSYQHPEIPGYWEQIKARDHVLEKHPGLRVVGCHLGSLEFDVDELAKRLDQYPNFAVDMAARIVHFQVQDREKVSRFILKYQDRLLYGTDNEFGAAREDPASALQELDGVYMKDYQYFGTDQEIAVPRIKPNYKVRGLALPASVLEKIFYQNALKWYSGI